MPTVVWSPRASRDIERHYNYLKLQNESTAKKAAQTIVRTGNSLEQTPHKGAIIEQQAGLRKLPVFFGGKYGYVIHYAFLADEVIILRVYHGRENRPH